MIIIAVGINVRIGAADDLDWIVAQLRAFSEFFGTRRSLFEDENFVRTGVLNLIEKHLLLVADKDMIGPVGFIAGVVTPHPFNPNIRVLSEFFWWVEPAHRGTSAGLRLLNAFVEWGEKNADWITFAIEQVSPVNEDVLTKRGFILKERSYLKETNAVALEVA